MDQFENLVGRAMLSDNPKERDLMIDRIECKAYASRLMFCPMCGQILDQADIHVLYCPTTDKCISEITLCSICAGKRTQPLREKAEKLKAHLEWKTWKGRKLVYKPGMKMQSYNGKLPVWGEREMGVYRAQNGEYISYDMKIQRKKAPINENTRAVKNMMNYDKKRKDFPYQKHLAQKEK